MGKMRKPKIALITPQAITSSAQIRRVQPPLGLGYVAAVLEEKGIEDILILDGILEDYERVRSVEGEDDLIVYGATDEALVEKVAAFGADIIGISSLFSSQVSAAISIGRALKKALPGAPIIYGGIHASKMFQDMLKESNSPVDYILIGEGDYTFSELVIKLWAGEEVTDVAGLAWREDGKIKSNPQPAYIPKLDVLPFPAWHRMNMEGYFKIGMPHNPFVKSGRVACIMTSRGCPEHCYFCSSADFFGHGFRAMTPSRVKDMIQYAVDRFGIKEIQIEDDTFTLNHRRVLDICEAIKALGLRVSLPNAIRADAPIDRKKRLAMYRAMKEAGWGQISVSVEHGDQEYLDKVIGKRLDLNEVIATCDLAHEAGLLIHSNFMMGFPHETEALRRRTMEFARTLDSDSYSVSLAAPLPGTKMWDIVAEDHLFMPNFSTDRVNPGIVSITPHDISPEDLYACVTQLNRELNEKAQKKRKEVNDKYRLLAGKAVSNDRKYAFATQGPGLA